MNEALMKFAKGELSLDMNGTTESDWRDLVMYCSRINFDLNKAAQKWWGPVEKSYPFIEYEQQNIKRCDNKGGWELQFRYLERDEGDGIHSVRNPWQERKNRTILSYSELKQKEEPNPEFTLDF